MSREMPESRCRRLLEDWQLEHANRESSPQSGRDLGWQMVQNKLAKCIEDLAWALDQRDTSPLGQRPPPL